MELHVYYSVQRLLRVSWGEVVTEESVRRHFDMLIANTHYARDLRIITSADIREVGFPPTQTIMTRISQWRQEALDRYDSITTAFYNINPVPSAYISYFSLFFDSPKSVIKQFSSEMEALRWLMQRDKNRTGRQRQENRWLK